MSGVRPFSRSDILRLAAEDASYGLRYVPPQPYLQMPPLPYFMPNLYGAQAPPAAAVTNSSAPAGGKVKKSAAQAQADRAKELAQGRGGVTRSRSNSVTSTVSGAPDRAPLASLQNNGNRPNKGDELSKPTRERRGSTDSTASSVPQKQQGASGAPSPALTNVSIPPVFPPPLALSRSTSLQEATAPSGSRTPRSIPSSTHATPRGSPRSLRSLSSSGRSTARRTAATGDESARGGKGKLEEKDVKKIVQELLQEEIKRVAGVDAESREHLADLALTRSARHDLLAREDEERRRRMEEETRRPNYYIHQAKEEVKEFKAQLLPLLTQADAALERLYKRSAIQGPQSSSLLHQLSVANAQLIASSADQLADEVLNSIMADTVEVLNRVEHEKQLDHEASISNTFMGDVWEKLERMEAQREEMMQRYAKKDGQQISARSYAIEPQRLPEVNVASVQSSPIKQQRFAAAAPSQLQPVITSSLSSHVAPAPSSSASSKPTYSSLPQALSATSASQPSVIYPTPTVPLRAETFATKHIEPNVPGLPRRVNLPNVSHLILECKRNVAEYEAYIAQKNAQQFLLPQQLQLHTIVQAVSDDILEELLLSNCTEVEQICDGFVERVFEQEFAVDLDQMVAHDLADQQQDEQQHDYQDQEYQGASFQDQQYDDQQQFDQSQSQEETSRVEDSQMYDS